jgi:enoyl-CoA hydratase/carnithine racemase
MSPEPLAATVPVRVRARGPVLIVTLDRPRSLNAIDPETHEELVRAWRRLRDEDRLKVGVLTGSGDRAFSAGIDLKRLPDFYAETRLGERRARWKREPGLGGLTRNLDTGKPIVAAINGYCLGLGLELALACDVRLASPNAVFGLPEVRWGIIPGQGGTQRLPRAVPPNLALEMILTGESIPASRAYEIGLINRIVPLPRLRPEALATAHRIARHPPRAVRHARESVYRGLDLSLADGLQLEQDLAEPLREGGKRRALRSAFGRKRTSRPG